MEIINDFKNELLKRREIKLITHEDINPGFAASLKLISEEFKSPEENVVVNNVKSKFGRDSFLIDAFIYDSLEDKERIEIKPKVKKVA